MGRERPASAPLDGSNSGVFCLGMCHLPNIVDNVLVGPNSGESWNRGQACAYRRGRGERLICLLSNAMYN